MVGPQPPSSSTTRAYLNPPPPFRQVLQNAERIGCRKYLTPSAIVAGNPKLNLAFVANLFNTWPGLEPLQETEKPVIDDFDAEGEREARVFTLWLNSLDVDPGVYNLFEDLKVRFSQKPAMLVTV